MMLITKNIACSISVLYCLRFFSHVSGLVLLASREINVMYTNLLVNKFVVLDRPIVKLLSALSSREC